MLLPPLLRDVAAALTDDDAELGLVVRLAGGLRQHHVVARSGDGSGELGEDGGDRGDGLVRLLRVVAVFEPDADELGRARDRRQQAHLSAGRDLAARRGVEPPFHAIERVGAAGDHLHQGREAGAGEPDNLIARPDAGLDKAIFFKRNEAQVIFSGKNLYCIRAVRHGR